MNSVVAQKPAAKPIELIRSQLYLPTMQEQLKSALPPHVTVEKFLRVAMTAIQQNPKLLEMERNSLFAAVVTAAQLGLLPDAQLGESSLVPFKGKVQLIPGYRGLIKLARQGDVGYTEAEVFCKNDRTTYILGDNSLFESVVNWEDRGPMIGVYALAKWRDGGLVARTVMSRTQVDAIRDHSPNATGPAWSNNYEEMAKKTAVRRLAKYLPLSTTAQNAMRLSELQDELGRTGRVIEGQVIDEEGDEPPPAAAAPETKPKRRRTALDDIATSAPPAQQTLLQEPTGDDSPDLTVDPDTGEVIHAPPPPVSR